MTSPCSSIERIVALETKQETLEDLVASNKALLEKIDAKMTRYQGFLGGISFVVGGLWVLWSHLKDYLMSTH